MAASKEAHRQRDATRRRHQICQVFRFVELLLNDLRKRSVSGFEYPCRSTSPALAGTPPYPEAHSSSNHSIGLEDGTSRFPYSYYGDLFAALSFTQALRNLTDEAFITKPVRRLVVKAIPV